MRFNQDLLLITLSVFIWGTCTAQVTPLEIDFQPFASGFNDPVGLYHCGDDRLFVVEQSDGHIEVLDANGASLGTFLDVGNLISTGSERGLLGLAFAPDYQTSGTFYINYTNNGGDTVIARYQVDSNDPDLADSGSAEIILTIEQPFGNHNGGHIAFGPDGHLYIGMGDGGSAGDPLNLSQNSTSLLGKMLRIDVSSGSGYSIPSDNPYISDQNTEDEIWAIGLRNPWKFSFDRETGDLWIGDVGQSAWEEIHFQSAESNGGENYGWRCYEGPAPYNTSGCLPESEYVFPVASVSHNSPDNWCSVTGGIVYRGSTYPAMQGKYFFTDYCVGDFYALTPEGGENYSLDMLINNRGFGYVAFGEDVNGELYAVRLNGAIERIVDTCGPFNPSINASNGELQASAGVAYMWFLNGLEVPGENGGSFEPETNGTVYALVENEEGCVRQTNNLDWITLSGVPGCTYLSADNYNPEALVDDGTCTFDIDTCPGDFDNDLVVGTNDLLGFLTAFGSSCD